MVDLVVVKITFLFLNRGSTIPKKPALTRVSTGFRRTE